MIVRIWRTQLDESRAGAYQEFARRRSVPMFRSQPGFAGVLFAASHGQRAVVTLWEDRAAVEALDSSPAYRGTVAAIEAAGFLKGESTVEVLEIEGALIEQRFALLAKATGITMDDRPD